MNINLPTYLPILRSARAFPLNSLGDPPQFRRADGVIPSRQTGCPEWPHDALSRESIPPGRIKTGGGTSFSRNGMALHAHIPGVHNSDADALSYFHWQEFRHLAPSAQHLLVMLSERAAGRLDLSSLELRCIEVFP